MKRQTLGLLCAAAATLIAPAATPAAAAETAHHHAAAGADAGSTDVRCLIFAMNMASSQDQGAKTVGFLGVAYYMGRIDAAGHAADLEPRMEAQITAMKTENVAPIAQACGQTLSGRMKAISTVGQQLQAKFAPQGAAAAAPLSLKPIPSPQGH